MTLPLHRLDDEDEPGFLCRLFNRDMTSGRWAVRLAGPDPRAGLFDLNSLLVPANDADFEDADADADADREEDDSPFDEELFWALMARRRRR